MSVLLAQDPKSAEAERRRRRDQLLLLLLLLLSDIPDAVRLWDALMPLRWRGLLLAEAIDNVRQHDGALPPGWFDLWTQRYGLGQRGFITDAAIVDALEAFRAAASNRASTSVSSVYDGRTDVGTWMVGQATEFKAVAIAVLALAVGGASQITQENLADAGRMLRFHFGRLERFAGQIERGVVTAEAAGRRAGIYPNAIVTDVYHDFHRQSAIAAGMLWEQNVLDPDADHCQPNPKFPDIANCPELSDRGWQPIGTMPPIGTRLCKFNCRCHWSFARERPEN